MKTSIAIVVVGGCLLGGVWAMAAEEPKDGKLSELNELKLQVETLRMRGEYQKEQIKRLEDRVTALEKEGMIVPRVPGAPEMRRTLPDRQVPKGWGPFEFNGHPYYVIPITQDPNKPLPTK